MANAGFTASSTRRRLSSTEPDLRTEIQRILRTHDTELFKIHEIAKLMHRARERGYSAGYARCLDHLMPGFGIGNGEST